MRFEGRVAIVTGGSSGIGKAVALGLAKDGADLAIADINSEQGKQVCKEIEATGRRAVFIPTDVRKSDQVNRMVDGVVYRLGRVDVLVNCAGGSARGRAALFHESVEDVWDYVIELNLKGTRNCCRAVVGPMMRQRSGKIVNIGSNAARAAFAKSVEYCTAKAGILSFTRALAAELVGYGINVNSVSPGPTDTIAMQSSSMDLLEQRKRSTGFGRLATVEEVANAVAFLASDEASFITGQDYAVCGLANLVWRGL